MCVYWGSQKKILRANEKDVKRQVRSQNGSLLASLSIPPLQVYLILSLSSSADFIL